MRILLLAAEATPLIKVGGLADVAGSLPKALQELGHEVRVAIPGYGSIDWPRFAPALRARFEIPHAAGPQQAEVYEVSRGGVTFWLLTGPPIPKDHRVYGAGIEEDGPKFIFFSLAALAACRPLDFRPDVLHANDWHAGAAVHWLSTAGRTDDFFRPVASLLTIHNLPYTGRGAGRFLNDYGLAAPQRLLALPDWARDSPLALALLSADMLSTVSPTYAREITTPEFGHGLDGILRARQDHLAGVLNGIDADLWNPATDGAIAARYDAETFAARARNKEALQKEAGLLLSEQAPLLAAVSRLDRQKGFEIAGPGVRRWLDTGGQFVLLGTGDPAIEYEMALIENAYPGRASVRLRFDSVFARRIYAGTDALLIPSRYEPCGLTQMIAMRYGAVPVVRRTGGLADTVIDASDTESGTGFLFGPFDPEALGQTLERVRGVYSAPAWKDLQRRGMRTDFSWSASARDYVSLYRLALAHRGKPATHGPRP
ncbi:MAG: glycogen synthase [Thermoanaerobaculia bacterium]